jgi:hypothetical protein
MLAFDKDQGILLVEHNCEIRDSIARAIESNFMYSEVVVNINLAKDLLQKKKFSVLILHIIGEPCFEFLKSCADIYPQMRIVLIISEDFKEYIQKIEDSSELKNIIALRPALTNKELISTIKIIFNNTLFNINYIIEDVPETIKINISDSKAKGDYIERASNFLSHYNISNRLLNKMLSSIDELVMNIIYNAPTNSKGEHIYKDLSRKERVLLSKEQAGVLTISHSLQYVGISGFDPFGSIDFNTIIEHLKRCFLNKGRVQINDKSGGSKIGLYQMYKYSDFFIVSKKPGKKTEFMLIFDLKLKDRLRSKYPKSFHYFEEKEES